MDQLDEVRSKIDIVSLISEYLPLKKSGRNFKALCPFHSEKVPSFMVSPERQIFKCFGCGLGGDCLRFLMEYEKMEFGEALRALAKRAGVKLAPYRSTESEGEKEKLYAINHLASEFYHYLLAHHPEGQKALEYLQSKRGVKKEMMELFKLGWAPSLAWGLQKFLVEKKKYKIENLLQAGLVSKHNEDWRDFFRGRIIFPLKDHRGNIVGFSGRVVGEWREEEASKTGPKYINIPETLTYHKGDLLYGLETTRQAIKSQNQALIVEGELDLISSYQVGIENVVAIKGSALTENQVRLLARFCENLVFALDRDLSGDAAARRGIEMAEKAGFNIQVVSLPQGKDPDELARENPAIFRKAAVSPIPIYDFFFQSALTRFNSQTAFGQKKISDELLPIFAKISNEIVKDHYLRQLAEKLGVSPEAVVAQMKKIEVEPPLRVQKEKIAEVQKPRREILEEYLLALVFQKNDPGSFLPTLKQLIKTPALVRILSFLTDFLVQKKKFTSQEFAQVLPPELLEIFNEFYLFDFGEKINLKKWFEKEMERSLGELEKISLRERLKDLSQRMAKAEKEGKQKELKKTKEEFLALSQKLGKMI